MVGIKKPHTFCVSKKTPQRWMCQGPQKYPETQGPNEPIEVDTRNAFMKAIALNGKIKAKIWRAVELMEREEMRTMIVITNYNGGLRVPALPQGDIHFV